MTSGISRRALGRGLTKLIPLDSEEKGSDNEVVLVDADSIRPNPFQPRREFNNVELTGLAESIKDTRPTPGNHFEEKTGRLRDYLG